MEHYSTAFKKQVVELALNRDKSIVTIGDIAKEKGIHESSIYLWINKFKSGESTVDDVPEVLVEMVTDEVNDPQDLYAERYESTRSIEIHHKDTQPFEVHTRITAEKGQPDELELIISKNGEQMVMSDRDFDEPSALFRAIKQLLNVT